MSLITESQPFSFGRRQTFPFARRQSQHSVIAKSVVLSSMIRASIPQVDTAADSQRFSSNAIPAPTTHGSGSLPDCPPRSAGQSPKSRSLSQPDLKPRPAIDGFYRDGVGNAPTDTPSTTTTNSPKISAMKPGSSGCSTPKIRPTTLDIPGLTKSKVSPDGKIAQRDVGSKLVIVMVGLPARGKSYITKKIARYLNWLQHDTRIFNVGERRRVVAHGSHDGHSSYPRPGDTDADLVSPRAPSTKILVNGQDLDDIMTPLNLPAPLQGDLRERIEQQQDDRRRKVTVNGEDTDDPMNQNASFFDPENKKASELREHIALETLNELLDYILHQGGSVGILDATNSTLDRRKWIMRHVRERAGPELNVLFVESVCEDETLLESNMRLKLSGPDYKDKDPVAALADFRKRVEEYQKKYIPLGKYEEKNNMPYVQIIDVGRKVISHQIRGFLSSQAVYYLLNFNLAPRTIWITRHGESTDNVLGKIGGDSDLSENGRQYGKALTEFIEYERKAWEVRQRDKAANTHFPPHPGDHTPPNPHYGAEDDEQHHENFCVWTSMLKRSIQSAEYFNEDVYETKQMRMLDELYAGAMEGMTYEEIKTKHADEYARRRADKLAYRYPGPGGEGYLDVINRLRPVIVELERLQDHCLIITHRSVARVLLAYFLGLRRDQVADLDCPLGMVYMLEPKPYGVEFKAFRYSPENNWFHHLPDFKLKRERVHH